MSYLTKFPIKNEMLQTYGKDKESGRRARGPRRDYTVT